MSVRQREYIRTARFAGKGLKEFPQKRRKKAQHNIGSGIVSRVYRSAFSPGHNVGDAIAPLRFFFFLLSFFFFFILFYSTLW